MLELLFLRSEIVRVGFHSCSGLLLMSNMRLMETISYIQCSQIAYHMIDSGSCILRIIQHETSNHSPVANLEFVVNS